MHSSERYTALTLGCCEDPKGSRSVCYAVQLLRRPEQLHAAKHVRGKHWNSGSTPDVVALCCTFWKTAAITQGQQLPQATQSSKHRPSKLTCLQSSIVRQYTASNGPQAHSTCWSSDSSCVPTGVWQPHSQLSAGRLQWHHHGVWADRVWKDIHHDR